MALGHRYFPLFDHFFLFLERENGGGAEGKKERENPKQAPCSAQSLMQGL